MNCYRKTLRGVFFLFAVILSLSISAQSTFNVSGKVTDESGEALIGASVFLRSAKLGTVTDINGNYSLNLTNRQATLVVSYLGFITQEIPVEGRNVINVTLREQNNTMNDVVVIGYGVTRKKDLTGAVASIKSDQLLQIPVVQPAEALQGRVAGLDVTRGNGDAGSGVTIRLRGNRSISTNKNDLAGYNEPLVIVDGMQGVSFRDITPNDILTIDVLKDAASTAIYGARGANGVIIVTTKAGQAGRPRLSVNSYYGISNVASYGDYMNTDEYVAYRIEQARYATANASNGWIGEQKTINDVGFTAEQLAKIEAGNDTYFPGLALHTGLQQEHNFNVSAGNENTKIYLSGSIYDEKGILKNDHYTRYTGRLNIDQKVYKWLDLGMRMQMAYSDNDKRSDPLNVARRIAPFETYKNEDGSLILNPGNIDNNANPLLDEDPANWKNNIYGTRFSGAAYAEFKPFEGFTVRSNFGTSLDNSTNGLFWGVNSVKALTSQTKKAGISQSRSDYRRYQWENIMTWNKNYNDIHQLTLTGVTSMEKSVNSSLGYTADAPAVYTQLWFNPDLATALGLSGNYGEREYVSLTARANYILKNKYILNTTMRYDASSKVNGNWAAFPSVGAAWRISDEKFISESTMAAFISNLKLRGSWGVSGNDNTDDYISQTELISMTNFSWNGTANTAYRLGDLIGNKDLTWEKTSTINLGLDLGLFRNHVNLTFDMYSENTTGLIAPLSLPPTSGARESYQNLGEVSNRGFEVLLETRNIATKDFVWNTTFTFASNKEKVESLPGGKEFIQQNGQTQKYSKYMVIAGYPVEIAYGYVNDGIWQIDEAEEAAKFYAKPGDFKLKDISGPNKEADGVINDYDLKVLGKMSPDYYGSVSNDIQWKGFDLNILMLFRANFWMSSDYLNKYEASGKNNVPPVNYWTPENPTGIYPRPGSTQIKTNSMIQHMMTLRENSFFKVKNVTLGYTVPRKVTERINIGNLRVWASAKNMIIFQKDPSGFDPENINNLGELMTDHPLNKLVTLGLNVEF